MSLLDERFTLLAPDLMLLELASVIWKKRMRSEISTITNHLEILNRIPNMLVILRSSDFVGEATRLAVELAHPVYDCSYLACAIANDIPLITADRRLREKASTKLPDVPLLDLTGVPVRQ